MLLYKCKMLKYRTLKQLNQVPPKGKRVCSSSVGTGVQSALMHSGFAWPSCVRDTTATDEQSPENLPVAWSLCGIDSHIAFWAIYFASCSLFRCYLSLQTSSCLPFPFSASLEDVSAVQALFLSLFIHILFWIYLNTVSGETHLLVLPQSLRIIIKFFTHKKFWTIDSTFFLCVRKHHIQIEFPWKWKKILPWIYLFRNENY